MSSGNYDCEIFINYHGRDVEENLAKSLYHRLREHELRVFMDVEEKLRKTKDRQIESAIRTASVHIALFSHAYAESPGCLEELVLMSETGATIIPVFYRVLAREIQLKARKIKEGNGQYGESLRWKEMFEGAPKEIIQQWSEALSRVSSLEKSFRLKDYNSDVERLVNAIVERVKESICYDVFINNDRDTQKTFATHLYRRLLFDGRRVFLDKERLREGNNLTPNIESAIQKASVHIAILCTKYAESSRCLNELLTMFKFKSNATIIPVFYGVKPSKLRSQIRDYTRLRWQNGLYDLLLRMLGRTEKENGQGALAFNSTTMENWKNNIDKVTGICGFELEEFNEDHGLLVSKIAERVSSIGQTSISHDVFINHRGDDCKKTLASHLYHRLVACRFRPFLDKDELQRGEELTPQIKQAIKSASVHIVILSKNYANSEWCMKELVLMLQTKATIIPVLYNVEITDLANYEDGESVYARAVHNLEAESIIDPGTNTFESWQQVLLEIERTPSFNLRNNNDDEGLLVDKVVEKVAQLCQRSSSSIWSRGKRS